MLTNLAHTVANQIPILKQHTATDTKVKQDGNNNSPTSHHTDHNNDKMTGTGTSPTKYLKCLRSSDVLSRSARSTTSLESKDSNSSQSDSARCNNKNMPYKMTGEMGLEIYPAPNGENKTVLRYVQDCHFQYIHPHVFAPACLTNVQRMGGGGSGIAVFSGTHPELGEIVMKHGGYSDMKELFALATIAAELKKRGSIASSDSFDAALSMKSCLPEFKMVYVSPQHVLFKEKEVWGKLRKLIRIGGLVSRVSSAAEKSNRNSDRSSSSCFASLISKMKETSENIGNDSKKSSSPWSLMSLDDSAFLTPGMTIRIYECDSGEATVYLDDKSRTRKASLAFVVPKKIIQSIHPSTVELDCSEEFNSLQHIYNGLLPLTSKQLFKFTLAQKRIGGENAKTGSQWLYEGKLSGLLLDSLISRFVKTVRNLQKLTLPEEVDVADQVRAELQKLKDSRVKADGLSTMANQFMGNAIKKNFDPTKGRLRFLRRTCQEFQEKKVFLIPEEELPAKHLGTLFEPNAFMSDVFVDASTEPPLTHPDKELWINLMSHAISERKCMSPNATKRIWTSGLADAGIHNLFVSEDDLYFFDLGEPQLQSMPGFMTKFLFSFFHVLGMEEVENGNGWVRRFVPQVDKLALTTETAELLPEAYDAFEVSLNRIIDEIFDGDQSLRWLLLQYVTLQLLSDAAFCIQRWNQKGGGSTRDDNHNKGLERWLWRALWDTYVAFDINTRESWDRLKVEHPSCTESTSSLRENIRSSIRYNHLDAMKLLGLLDEDEDEDEDEDNADKKKHISCTKRPTIEGQQARTKTTGLRDPANRRRTSLLQWPSERLNHSNLRDLTAATFEYNPDDHNTSDQSDDDDEDESDSSSAILPIGLHISSGSLGSLAVEEEE